MAKGNFSLSKTAVWILLSLLIVGLAGFGATSLSGTVRTIGTVGDKSISVDTYARQLQQEIRAIEAQTREPLPFSQAQQLGLDRAVLRRLIATRALDNETAQLGLSIGDASLRDRILDIPAFRGIDGEFDREGYSFALQQTGLSEAEFETQLREEVSRTILQGSILTGIAMPDAFADTLIDFVGERRGVTWTRLDETALETAIPAPTDAQLRAYYDENIEAFTLPETKQITYAALSPSDLIDSVEIDPAALQQAYDERAEEFIQPERRLVERLVYLDAAAADAARASLEAGQSFEDLVKARGLALQDIDLGDVSEADLAAAGPDVFAAEVGAVLGPLDSDLGPALFRVNAVLPAMNISLEEAESFLRPQIAIDRAQRLVDAQAQSYDDMLAGGATLEELATDTDMILGTIGWFAASDEDIAAYPAFRDAAAAVTLEDFPQIDTLDDGGLFALRLDEVLAPRPAAFDDVRDDVAALWQVDQVRAALEENVQSKLGPLRSGESFASQDMDAIEEDNLLRSDVIVGVPATFMQRVFEMDTGDVEVLEDGAGIVLVRLDSIDDPEESEETIAIRAQLATQASDALAQDLFNAFTTEVTTRANPQINQQAIQAVHVNFP
ncbi:MAG: peptidyl-prolyl cis-trans isomerase [Roseobacter sp.]